MYKPKFIPTTTSFYIPFNSISSSYQNAQFNQRQLQQRWFSHHTNTTPTTTSLKQIQLNLFDPKPKNAAVVFQWKSIEVINITKEICLWLKKNYQINIRGEPTLLEGIEDCVKPLDLMNPTQDIDFCIVIGGDGTLLHFNKLFQEFKKVPPVVPFAMGSLGFLLPYPVGNYKYYLENILSSPTCTFLQRTRLLCYINQRKEGAHIETSHYQCLNELFLSRGESPFLSTLEFYVNDQLVTLFSADGLIISSPTGSTAYSMSAGGTVMPAETSAILVTPVCPHCLSFRPIVLPESCTLKIRVPENSRSTAVAFFDGRNKLELKEGDFIQISTSPYPLPTYSERTPLQEWFTSIQQQLHWNSRKPQNPLPP